MRLVKQFDKKMVEQQTSYLFLFAAVKIEFETSLAFD